MSDRDLHEPQMLKSVKEVGEARRTAWSVLAARFVGWLRDLDRPVPRAECEDCPGKDALIATLRARCDELAEAERRRREACVRCARFTRKRLAEARGATPTGGGATRAATVLGGPEEGLGSLVEVRRSVYERIVASQRPKPQPQSVTREEFRATVGEVRPTVSVAGPVLKGCHRRDGRPALTTPETVKLVREQIAALGRPGR